MTPATPKRPRIAVNGRFLAQGAATGVQRYAREMVRALAALSPPWDGVLWAPRDIGAFAHPWLERDTSPLTGVGWELLRLPWLARRRGAEVLWCPGNTAPLVPRGTALVVTVHDAAVFAQPGWFSPWFRWYYRLLPILWRRAQRIVTVSEFSRSELKNRGLVGREQDIAVIPCGLTELPGSAPASPDRERLRVGRPYILALGSGNPRKNTPRLLEAWAGLPVTVKQGRLLVLISQPGDLYGRERQGRLPEDVIRRDYVTDVELAELYRGADIFIYPSLYEGFGMPPLEAMAVGTPVLTAGNTSVPEVCGGAAIYCDPYSVADLRDKLARMLLDAAGRQELSRRGRERAREFSWEHSARRLAEVLLEVCDRRGR